MEFKFNNFNLTPEQKKLLKKNMSAEKFDKLEDLFDVFEDDVPTNANFKCLDCNYQSNAGNFKSGNTIKCPKCGKTNFQMISKTTKVYKNGQKIELGDELDELAEVEDDLVKAEAEIKAIPSSQNTLGVEEVNTNKRLKIIIVILIIALIGLIVYQFIIK